MLAPLAPLKATDEIAKEIDQEVVEQIIEEAKRANPRLNEKIYGEQNPDLESHLDQWREFICLRESVGFAEPRTVELRDELFFNYRGLSTGIAKNYIRNSMPYQSLIDSNDIFSEAELGLLKAINTYELGKGASFKTHAYIRIKGAIIDGLRGLQDFPRIVAAIKRELAPLLESLSHDLQRNATLEELWAKHPKLIVAGLTIEEVASDPLVRCNVFNQAFDEPEDGGTIYTSSDVSTGNEGMENMMEIQLSKVKDNSKPVYSRLQFIDTIEKILKFLSDDRNERSVIYCYFFLGMTSTEISKTIKISPTWVSSKKDSGLKKIRREVRTSNEFAEELLG